MKNWLADLFLKWHCRLSGKEFKPLLETKDGKYYIPNKDYSGFEISLKGAGGSGSGGQTLIKTSKDGPKGIFIEEYYE